MSGPEPDRGPGSAPDDLPGRRTAITWAHRVTIAISALVAVIALGSVLFAEGPRGSVPLGLVLSLIAAATAWVGWVSLATFRATDRPRLLWMGLVGLAWMGVALVAPSV